MESGVSKPQNGSGVKTSRPLLSKSWSLRRGFFAGRQGEQMDRQVINVPCGFPHDLRESRAKLDDKCFRLPKTLRVDRKGVTEKKPLIHGIALQRFARLL